MGDKGSQPRRSLKLLHQYFETDSLRKNAYAVEGVIAISPGSAARTWRSGDRRPDHDPRLQKFPDQHLARPGRSWKRKAGRRNISGPPSPTDGICSDVEPQPAGKGPICHRRAHRAGSPPTALIRPFQSVNGRSVKS